MRKILTALLFALIVTSTFVVNANYHELTKDGGHTPGNECKWATRETSAGWEAICITTGVGYTCTCGSVKKY